MPKALKEFPAYTIYPNGDVIGARGRMLKKDVARNGYHRVTFSLHRKTKRFSVHRLVCILYKSNPKNKPFVNHKDGVKSNNHKSNLEWVTSLENVRHCLKNGLQDVTGVANPAAKLTDKQIRAIRKAYAKGNTTHRKLAAQYGLTKTNIQYIVNYHTWKHIH